MDALSLLRTFGALATVLGMLAGALWIVRRYNIRLPGSSGAGGPTRRLEIVERAALDGRRSVALLRRDGREHLILLAPEGNVMLETAIVRDTIDEAAEAARLQAEREAAAIAKAEAEAMRESFFAMVDKAREGMKGKVASVTGATGLIKPAPQAEAGQEPAASAELETQADARPDVQANTVDKKPELTVAEAKPAVVPSTMAEAPLPPAAPAPARKRTRTRTSVAQPKRPRSTAAKRRTSGTASD